MTYYRLLIFKEGEEILFTDIIEGKMKQSDFEAGNWAKPVTRLPSEYGVALMSFEKDYLEAVLSGLALAKELNVT